MKTVHIKLDDIRIDGGTQVRVEIDQGAVNDYAEAIGRQEVMPPVDVFDDGSVKWLAHGFHRYHAAAKACMDTIECIVHQGTCEQAAWFGLGANRTNGMRLTNADKVHAIMRAWTLKPHSSSRAIAELIGVSDHTVEAHRPVSGEKNGLGATKTATCANAHLKSPPAPPPPARRTGKDGKQYPAPPPAKKGKPPKERTYPKAPKKGAPAQPAEDPVDEVGNPIPNAEIAKAFARAVELDEAARTISEIKVVAMKAIDAGDPLYRDMVKGSVEADCKNLRNQFTNARPHSVCPYCAGEKCKACKQRGWVNKQVFDNAPSEMKRMLKKKKG